MYYFRFEIPTNADGTRATYSPGWHGTMPKCPKNVTVTLYNDKEGYGIAETEDTKLPKEVTAIEDKEVFSLLSTTKDEDGVYFGQKLKDRWNPEVLIEDKPVEEVREDTLLDTSTATKKAIFCPICHQFIMWLPSNIIAKTIQLTCPIGHRVVLNG